MKAKIKANGEIVNILKEDVDFVCADNGYIYKFDDIELLSNSNVENNAWGEEDENMIDMIISDLERHGGKENSCYSAEIYWLKSLKDRLNPQWKPSKEQIQALDEVYKTHGANNSCRRIIFNLLNDLKKLTHE